MTAAVTTEPRHPAKYRDAILDILDLVMPPGDILDPFAGVGRIHRLARPDRRTWAVELERGFVTPHPRTIVGDALHLPFADATFNGLATSPTFGNRMADRYDGRDGSVRHTYRLSLGAELHPGNSGSMQWGSEYRDFHTGAYAEAARVLRDDAVVAVNMKDHVRGGARQPVTNWHVDALSAIGRIICRIEVPSPGIRHGANHGARIDTETVIVARRHVRSIDDRAAERPTSDPSRLP